MPVIDVPDWLMDFGVPVLLLAAVVYEVRRRAEGQPVEADATPIGVTAGMFVTIGIFGALIQNTVRDIVLVSVACAILGGWCVFSIARRRRAQACTAL